MTNRIIGTALQIFMMLAGIVTIGFVLGAMIYPIYEQAARIMEGYR